MMNYATSTNEHVHTADYSSSDADESDDRNNDGDDNEERKGPTASAVTVSGANIMNYSPCHMLISACRAKLIRGNTWKDFTPSQIIDATSFLDPDLRKTYPLFYCIYVGQMQYPCLHRRSRGHNSLLFRDANVLLAMLLRSSDDRFFTHIDAFLRSTPPEDYYRSLESLKGVHDFADRHILSMRLSRSDPTGLADEETLVTSLHTFLTASVHSSCQQDVSRFFNFNHQGVRQLRMISDNERVPDPTLLEFDLVAFIQACNNLAANTRHDLVTLASQTGSFQNAYQRLLRHNDDSQRVRTFAQIIFLNSQLTRTNFTRSANVQNGNPDFFNELVNSYNVARSNLAYRADDTSLAYYLLEECKLRPMTTNDRDQVRAFYYPPCDSPPLLTLSACTLTYQNQASSSPYTRHTVTRRNKRSTNKRKTTKSKKTSKKKKKKGTTRQIGTSQSSSTSFSSLSTSRGPPPQNVVTAQSVQSSVPTSTTSATLNNQQLNTTSFRRSQRQGQLNAQPNAQARREVIRSVNTSTAGPSHTMESDLLYLNHYGENRSEDRFIYRSPIREFSDSDLESFLNTDPR